MYLFLSMQSSFITSDRECFHDILHFFPLNDRFPHDCDDTKNTGGRVCLKEIEEQTFVEDLFLSVFFIIMGVLCNVFCYLT